MGDSTITGDTEIERWKQYYIPNFYKWITDGELGGILNVKHCLEVK